MLPISLRVKNFFSHSDSFVDFSKFDIALVIGSKLDDKDLSNGSGKSSLFVDAISWCLFNEFRGSNTKNITSDRVIKSGFDKASVEFIFSINDVVYKVYREKSLKSSTVMFQVKSNDGWKNVSDTLLSNSQTDKKICEVLKIDYSLFSNSIVFGQGFATAFATATPAERKKLISNILSLDKYDLYEKQAKIHLENIQNQINELSFHIQNNEQLQQQLKQTRTQLEKNQNDLNEHKNERQRIEKQLKQLSEKKEQLLTDVVTRKTLQETISNIRNKIDLIESSINQKQIKIANARSIIDSKKEEYKKLKVRLDSISSCDISELEEQQKKIEDTYRKLFEQETSLKAELDNLKKQIKDKSEELKRVQSLKSGKCPICYSTITEESKQSVALVLQKDVEELKTIYVKQKEEYDNISSNCKKCLDDKLLITEQISNERKKSDEKQLIQKQIDAIKSEGYHQKDIIVLLQNEIDEQNTQKKQLEVELENKINELSKLDSKSYENEIKNVESEILSCEFLLQSINNEIENLISEISSLQKVIENTEQILQKSIESEQQIKSLQQELNIYKDLVTAFGKNGIQAYIFENCSIEIENTVNELLAKMTNNEMKIDIVTQKKNRDGSVSETFDIIISDKNHSDLFEMFSGGEQLRIAIAIRIALSKLIARRSGAQIRFMIFDEATSFLDSDGIDKFVSCINNLYEDFEKIIVITHQSELKDYFDNIIVVNKYSEGSRVEQK